MQSYSNKEVVSAIPDEQDNYSRGRSGLFYLMLW